PATLRGSSPIGPEQLRKRRGAPLSFRSATRARFPASGRAPLLMASDRRPSVPLRPTAPPIPAMGLTRNPIVTVMQGLRVRSYLSMEMEEEGNPHGTFGSLLRASRIRLSG